MHQGPKPKRIHQVAKLSPRNIFIKILVAQFGLPICGASVLMQRISGRLTSPNAGSGWLQQGSWFVFNRRHCAGTSGNTWSKYDIGLQYITCNLTYITSHCTVHITLHSITLPYIRHMTLLHYAAYITLHCMVLHYSPWQSITLRWTYYIRLSFSAFYHMTFRKFALHTLQYFTLHDIPLHCTHCIAWNSITLHYVALYYSTVHFTTSHCTHYIALCYIMLHSITLH